MQRRSQASRAAKKEEPSLFDTPPPPRPAPAAPAPAAPTAPAATPASPRAPEAPAKLEPAAAEPPRPFTVTELTRELAARLYGLGRVRVEGEICETRAPNSGHLYFNLKDAGASLACVVWRSQVGRLRLGPQNGALVVAHGKLDVYAPRGTYNLVVERLEPVGIGALLARLEELKAELRALGWLDRRRPLPSEPRVIGVVTSRDGAALRDFLRTRSLRWPGYPVRLAHTSVQGPGAAFSIADAVARLARTPGVDVIVLCRGGGSLEDLWAFNERLVAEAIWRSPVPVVTGVGHETDVTLADLVADLRAHTPTDAAQTAIPDRAARVERLARAAALLAQGLERHVEGRAARVLALARRRVLRAPAWIVGDRERALAVLARRARRAVEARARDGAARLAAAHARLERRSPRAALASRERRLAAAGTALERSAERQLDRAAMRVAVLARGLEATSPLAVLGRGYSVTLRADRMVPLTDAAGVAPGEELVTRLARGRLRSRVEAVEPGFSSRADDREEGREESRERSE